MPVNDSEPRYQLVETDAQGNVTDVLSSVYAEADGTLKLQEGSGSNNEAALQPDGTLDVPKVSIDDATIAGLFSRGKRWANLSLDGNQTVTVGGDKLAFTEIRDEYDEFDTTTNTFSPTADGLYMFVIRLQHTGLASGDWIQAQLYQNGSIKEFKKRDVSTATGQNITLTTFNQALASDSYEFYGASSGGSTIDSGSIGTKVFVVRLG